ncbi:MAG: alanine--glyoxylate aminotransferase family protein [Dehalococcoidia bacterium]|jgi:aspartate aminotransferase-like enzyme
MDNLRIPGPTPLPDEVLKTMSRQMINHRGPEFKAIQDTVLTDLKKLFMTQNDVFLLTGSGTGGLEAGVVNTMSPGDKVLSVSIGVFGDRFAAIAKHFGADVINLNFEWGQAADPDAIRKALQTEPKIKTVLVTHNETSTGVTNDLKAISAVVKEFDKLLVVDAISSLGSVELPVDDWNIDIAITGSQKGWMVPPGLAMVSVSEKGWKAHAESKIPSFYWDFGKAKDYLSKGQTPWTPAVSVVYGLEISLKMMLKEGLPNIFARHARLSQKVRDGVKAMGLSLFADPAHASNTVTSVAGSKGLDTKKLVKLMREEEHVVLAGGQRTLDGKIFRIGHLGWVNDKDIDNLLVSLKKMLPKAGFTG